MKEQNNKKMKKFIMNRETMSDERIEFLKSLIETNPDKYNVMVDLRTGNIRLLKSAKSKYYVHIGQIDLRNPKSTKLYIQKKGSELYQLIRKYNSTCLRCKTTVLKKYGKKGLIDKSFVVSLPNPHYKWFCDMELYDENVIMYYLQKMVS